jgi:hypothetical protein
MMLLLTAMAVVPVREREPFFVARIAAYTEYFDGSRQVGEGTRKRYDGGGGGMDMEVVRVPDGIGAEIRIQAGGYVSKGNDRAGRYVMFEGGAAGEIFSTRSFSLAGALGVGIAGGRYVFVDKIRFYPYVGLRARAWLSDRVSLHLNPYFLPITTSGVKDRELRTELALGISNFIGGLRGSWITWAGGDPHRQYGELALTVFGGAAFF